MKIAILCNGNKPSDDLIKRHCSDAYVICVDGAAKWAKGLANYSLLVGDFDSLDQSEKYFDDCKVIKLPEEKDETDTQIAVQYAIEKGAKEIVILGATGSRLDHTLANVQLLIKCFKSGIKAYIEDDNNKIYVTCTTFEAEGKKGDLLSIIPLGINVEIAQTEGLYYPLQDAILDLGTPLCISNVFTGNKASVSIAHGWAAIILAKD